MGWTIKNNSLCKAIYLSSLINLTFEHITIVYNGEYCRFVAICHVVFQTILFHLEVRVLFLCLLPSSLYQVFFEFFLLFEYNAVLIKRTQQVITFIKHAICDVHRHLTWRTFVRANFGFLYNTNLWKIADVNQCYFKRNNRRIVLWCRVSSNGKRYLRLLLSNDV